MSFTCKNCNTPLTAGQAAPVTPSLFASPSSSKSIKLAWIGVVVLFVMGFGSKGAISAPAPRQSALGPGTHTGRHMV